MNTGRFANPLFLAAFLVTIAAFCAGQTSTEVLYVQENTSILTYDVDPSTLQATGVGQTLVLPGNAEYVDVIPAPTDRFVYITSGSSLAQISLSVYPTDSTGVPQPPAVQTFSPVSFGGFTVDPNGKFAYFFQNTVNSRGESVYEMRLFAIDGTTGKLTENPQVHVRFAPSFYCTPNFDRFREGGSEIVYEVFCTPPDSSSSATFYSRSIDPQTGALGGQRVIYAYSHSNTSDSDLVWVGQRSINDLNVAEGQTSMKVFAIGGGKNPVIDCTSAMLAACGEASQFWQDVAGQFLLFQLPTAVEVTKANWSTGQIFDTGNSIVEGPVFSPDDAILYGVSYSNYVQIYGFDATTGGITRGGQIATQNFWNVFPALPK